ncbi:fibrinogen-like protein 1 [Haliotis cracherodii]|uniref:fibrinogen-like protein 1 n=1 Tax=Haliotis cracherodii TaxID=6455 RepID=UPI0039EAF2BB
MRVVLALMMVPGFLCNTMFTKTESCLDPPQAPDTYSTAKGLSSIECGVLCGQDDRCRAFSVREGNGSTCYLSTKRIRLDYGCSSQFKHFNEFDSRCHFHGIFINSTYGCRCYDGYIGSWCARLMQDCTEGWKTDHYKGTKEAYYIQPFNSPVHFKVFCRMVHGGKTFQMNQRFEFPSVNFSRPWAEYKHGFGDYLRNGNHWTGLNMLHYVTTNRPHQFIVIVHFNEAGEIHWRQRFYKNFTVTSEVDGYRFDFLSSQPNVGGKDRKLEDGLSALQGARFSTYDTDNDLSGDNCADIHQSGWWFTTCGGYNPTGQPQSPAVQNKTSDPTHMSWPHHLGYSAISIQLYVKAT